LKTTRWLAVVLWPLASAIAWAQATPASPSNPAYLASNCANCHGTTGNAKGGMPSLAGQPKAYLIEQMMAFRDGKRVATIMPQLAKGYTEAQIDAIAYYFSRQPAAR